MNLKNKYVSLFKIDGMPIIPPLITEKKRQELLRDKEQAMAIETKLKIESKNKLKVIKETTVESDEHELNLDDEYLKVSNLLQKSRNKTTELISNAVTTVSGRNPILNLNKSDTFIFDVVTNTVIIPYDNEIDQCLKEHKKQSDAGKIVHNKILPHTDRVSYIVKQEDKQICGGLYTSRKPIPLIHVKPPTPEMETDASNETDRNKFITCESNESKKYNSSKENIKRTESYTGEIKTPKRSTTSPSLKNSENGATPLIRSNSFTLDSPSSALIEHMVKKLNKEKIKSPEVAKKFDQKVPGSKGKESLKLQNINLTPGKTKKVVVYSQPKSERKANPEPKVSTLLITNSSMFKNKKSPYELKLSGRNKPSRKHKFPIVKTISTASIKHRNRNPNKKSEVEPNIEEDLQCIANDSDIEEILKLEENQKIKLLELLKIQQEEHRRMQETFEIQKQKLLMEIKENSGCEFDLKPELSRTQEKVSQKLPNFDQSYQESDILARNAKNSKFSSESGNNKSYTKISPRRRLFAAEDVARCNEKPATPMKRREKAATIINAYVRGYLVRRLFKTNYVKRLVQTIRDTLLFVLELHIETRFDDSEENIKLKARLLQQLSSSCYTLHHIFCELSCKERMNIIAKDRLFIKTNSRRSPRLR